MPPISQQSKPEWFIDHLKSSNIDQVVFMHIGKTGGTSITRELINRFDMQSTIEIGESQFSQLEHMGLKEKKLIVGHISNDQLKHFSKNRFLFSMVRDPVDRVISTYYFAKNYPGTLTEDNRFIIDSANNYSLSDFLKIQDPRIQTAVCNQQTYAFAKDWTISQKRNENEDNILELALKNLELFNFVGIYELYDLSMQFLCHNLGFLPWPSQNILNKTAHRKKADEFPTDIINQIISLNKLDIELYNACHLLFHKKLSKLFTTLSEKKVGINREKFGKLEKKPFIYTFEYALDGIGWHQREISNTEFYRWMGPNHEATIWLPIDRENDRIIRFYILDWNSIAQAKEIRLFDQKNECQRNSFEIITDTDQRMCIIEWNLLAANGYNITEAGTLRLLASGAPKKLPNATDPADRVGYIAVSKIEVL